MSNRHIEIGTTTIYRVLDTETGRVLFETLDLTEAETKVGVAPEDISVDIDALLIGRHAAIKPGAKPAGWDSLIDPDNDDLPDRDRGQITGVDRASNTVEVFGWWYAAADVEVE